MFSIFKPFIFSLDPETAHDLAINSLKLNVLPKHIFQVDNEELLETNLFNKTLPNMSYNLTLISSEDGLAYLIVKLSLTGLGKLPIKAKSLVSTISEKDAFCSSEITST